MFDSSKTSLYKHLKKKDKLTFISSEARDDPPGFNRELKQILKDSPWFKLFVDACTGCGACAMSCPDADSELNVWNKPWSRLELAGQTISHLTPIGGLKRVLGQSEPTPVVSILNKWEDCFYSCRLCRACLMDCPLNIDVSLISRRCRQAIAHLGRAPKDLTERVESQIELAGGMELSSREVKDACLAAARGLKHDLGFDLPCPVDQPEAEVLLIPSVWDFKNQGQGIKAYAKIFHSAKVAWTISGRVADAANTGYWLDDNSLYALHEKALQAVHDLRPGLVIWGESGHGWAVAERLGGIMREIWESLDSLDAPRPVHIYQWLYHMLRQGAFHGKLNRKANESNMIAYHDPCHLVHSSKLRAEPRFILNASAPFVFELPRADASAGDSAVCCGSGGGVSLLGPEGENQDGFAPLAGIITRAMHNIGVDHLACGCAECMEAIKRGAELEKLDIGVSSVVQVMGNALYFDDDTE